MFQVIAWSDSKRKSEVNLLLLEVFMQLQVETF